MRKKFLGVLVILVATSMTVAASGSDEGGPVVLNYWTWHPSAEIIQPVIDDFEAANPGVTINLTVMASVVYQEKLPIALASGEELDIIGVQTGIMPSKIKNYLTPLDPYFKEIAGDDWESIFNPLDTEISRDQTETEDLLFVTAGRYGATIGLYNVGIFEELGLKVPTTYAEMKVVAKTIRQKKPDIMPVVFSGDDWVLTEMVLTLLAQDSPELFNDIRYGRGGRWDDPAHVQALRYMKKMFDDGVFMNMNDISYGRAAELFDTEKAAIFYQGTWEAPRLSNTFREERGIMIENVGAMAMPIMSKTGNPTLRAFTDIGFGVPQNSKNQDIAAKFAFYMTGGDGFDTINTSNFLVPNKQGSKIPADRFNSKEGTEGWDLVVKLVSEATSHRNNMPAFSDVVGKYIQKVIAGEYGDNIEKACADIQKEFETGLYN